MMTGSAIRQHFFDFFKSKNHVIVPSAPIVMKDDPTLLFTNAGMNQFKDIFLGNKTAVNKRVADTQKCLRVSGKHNDLEEVGVDTYHHTMFEMLGNWSFGDYFKKEAIEWSWELLTKIYNIPEENLYITIFEGDIEEGLPKDNETEFYWKEWIDEDRIVMGNKKDNFWEMGEIGPCGPCTEIHVDCRSLEDKRLINGKSLVNKDHPQVIEIWNNVFIEYNRKKDGILQELPAKHVDTGMGLERLTRVLQNKSSNYDTDIFAGTLQCIEQIVNLKYEGSDSKKDIAFRVIADHIRAIAFTISDGQMPSNTGAGYVIRRILRRSVRYYFSYLDYKQPLLYKIIPSIARQFNEVFPELEQQSTFIIKIVHEEELSFLRTLDSGLKKMHLLTSNGNDIDGKVAFELYDTFGFPIDLTKLIASENNIGVDERGFVKEMLIQKNRSRKASLLELEDWINLSEANSNTFVGYNMLEAQTKVVKYRKTKLQGKEMFQIVLSRTPFYAESGGQVGDKGSLQFNNETIEVVDTKKENDLIIHFTETLPANIKSVVNAKVIFSERKNIASHHTATHLLHAALRKVLGNHVTQKGSLVNSSYLRFDFSHFSKLTDEEIIMIEQMVNQKIRDNIVLAIDEKDKSEALSSGAMALFGEKYGDKVRVVTIDPTYSIELCGGTHVLSTGELGIFKITQETAIGSGLRRIEGVCGIAAERWINNALNLLNKVQESLKKPKDLIRSLEAIINENNILNSQLEKFETANLSVVKKDLIAHLETINGINFIGKIVEVKKADQLKKLCFLLKAEINDHLVVLTANVDGKAFVALSIADNIATLKNLDAAKIVKEYLAAIIRGGGGGQKTLATAGGEDISQLDTVIEKVKGLLQ